MFEIGVDIGVCQLVSTHYYQKKEEPQTHEIKSLVAKQSYLANHLQYIKLCNFH